MKIAIIGAGTCGLYLGWKLSEKGHHVVIYEKKKEIADVVCSGLFSQRIFNFIPQSKELIQNEIDFALLNFPKKTIKLGFSKKFLVMSHSKLDQLLFSLAEQAGTKILFNQDINSKPKGFDRIIGCDGANSVVRRGLNLPDPSFRLGIQGFVKERSFLNYVETWPCKHGFIWKIPRGEEIEYGIITKSNLANNLFQEFLKKNNILIGQIRAKVIPQGFVLPLNESITLCGDAAGMTKPWSGGGVIWNLSAADMILKTFPDFNEYRRKAKRFFVPKIKLSKIAIKTGYFLGFKASWIVPKNIKFESDFLL